MSRYAGPDGSGSSTQVLMGRPSTQVLMGRPGTQDLMGREELHPSVLDLLLLSSVELSDTTICEPEILALLGTTSHFCEAVVPKP